MTAIVAGQGLGLINTSLGLLGGQGQIGSASQGASGEKVVVNAANGNLVIQQQDEWLVGIGPDVVALRTYNSQAASADDDNGDNWRLGLSRKIIGTYPNSVTRVAEDGGKQNFTYNVNDGTYRCFEGGGSVDILRWDGTSWIWTDGDTQVTETYEQSGSEFRLKEIKDVDGHRVVLTYSATNAKLVTQIATWKFGEGTAAETIEIEYVGANIQSMTTKARPSATGTAVPIKRMSYQYDEYNRLQQVTVDLTPENTGDQTADLKSYVTKYTYVDTSTRNISKMEQGTLAGGAFQVSASVGFTYEGNKVKTITEVVGAQTQTTTLTYTGTKTTVKDALDQVTELTFDAATTGNKAQQLLSIKMPAAGGATAQESFFEYDNDGNVTSIKDARGNTVIYRYDASGNRIYERDAQGNVVERSFSGTNKLLTETVYTGLYAEGTNATQATGGKTTRYVYDAKGHLRFVVSPEGRVTEHQYNNLGQRTSTLQYDDVGTVNWEQDFSAGTSGLTLTSGTAQAGVYWTTYNGVGALKVETKSSATRVDGVTPMPTSGGEYPSAYTDSKPLGTSWRTEFTLPANPGLQATSLMHIGLETGSVSAGNYQRYFLQVSGGQLVVQGYTPPSGYPPLATLGAAEANTKYVMELVTQPNGDTRMYVYKSGQSRSSSPVTPTVNLETGTGAARFTIIGYRNVSTPAGDVYVHSLSSSLTPAEVGLSTWRQDFESGYGGITLPTSGGIDWGTVNGDGVLKITSKKDTDTSFPTARTEYQSLGGKWRAEFTLPAALGKDQLNIGLESGTQGQSDYRRNFLRVTTPTGETTAKFYLAFAIPPAGYPSMELGEAVPGKTYVVEFETEVDGTTRLYVYESGKDRASGYTGQTSMANGTGVARMALIGYNSTGVDTGDTLVRSLSYTLPTGQGALTQWQQDFSKDASGFTESTLPAAMALDASKGMLKISAKNTTAATTTPTASLPVQPLGTTWRAEVRTGSTIPDQLLMLGIDAGAGTTYRRAHIQFSNGKIQFLTSPTGTTASIDLVAAAKINTTYVVEFASQTDGSVKVSVYEKNAGRASAVTGTANLSDSGQPLAKFTLKTLEGSGATNGDIWVDNLSVALVPKVGVAQSWTQEFVADAGGLTSGTLPDGITRVTDPADARDGMLKFTSANAVSQGWPTVKVQAKPLGTNWRTEIETSGSVTANLLNIGIWGNAQGDANYRRNSIAFSNGNIYSVTFPNGGNSATTQFLGTALLNTRYVLEIETQADGQSVLYIYPKSAGRNGAGAYSLKVDMSPTGLSNLEFFAITYRDPAVSTGSYLYMDNVSYTLPGAVAQQSDWLQNFATNMGGLQSNNTNNLLSSISWDSATQALKVANVKTSSTDLVYPAALSDYQPFGSSWRMELSLPATTGTQMYIGLENGSTGPDQRRMYLYVSNGRLKMQTYRPTVGSVNGNYAVSDLGSTVDMGAYKPGRTYVVELVTQADGQSQIYVYEKGSTRSQGVVGRASLNNDIGANSARLTIVSQCNSASDESYVLIDNLSLTRETGETELAAWAASQRAIMAGAGAHQSISRTDYAYDFRGQLNKTTTFEKVSGVNADGVSAGKSETLYNYDQMGRLLSRTSGLDQVSYTYDGLNRVKVETIGQLTRTTVYDDQARTATTTQNNGLSTVNTYDQKGNLLTVKREAASIQPGTTTYGYDKLNRLSFVQAPSGEKTYYVYDEASRKVGEIDAEGFLTEYIYNKANQVSTVKRYKNVANTANIPASGLEIKLGGTSGVRPADSTGDDRITYNIYDKAGRLIKTVDPAGAVVEYRYDGAGRLTDTVRYATMLTSSQLISLANSSQELGASIGKITYGASSEIALTTDATNDRRERNFYSADGLLIGKLDAEGYYTQNVYDKLGRLRTSTRLANKMVGTLTAGNTPPAVITKENSGNSGYILTSAKDETTQYVYNSRNQLIGQLDAEGYYTAYQYDAAGNKTGEIRRYNKIVGRLSGNSEPLTISASAATPSDKFSYVRSSTQDIDIVYTYDASNRLQKTTQTQGGVSTIATYDYDSGNNLTKVTSAKGAAEERASERVYDALGRLIEELSAEGAKAVANVGAGERAKYLTTHEYDSAGRRISTKTPDGLGGTAGLKTVFYYDKKGQLTYSINALGEVTRYAYNSFGQQTEQVRMNGKVTPANYNGGLFSALSQSLRDALTNLDNQSNSNNKVEQVFDQRGLVKSLKDGYGTVTQASEYNAFGELRTLTKSVDAGTAQQTLTYDKRGQLKQTDEYDVNTSTSNGILRTTKATYDAFGRVLTRTDGMNGVTTYTYDQHGRQVTVKDRTTKGNTVTTYDAFSRVMSVQDQMGQTTTYTYDPATLSVMIKTPENVETTTTRNRHGEVVSIKDGLGNITTYEYDNDGQLKSTKVADGTSEGITSGTTYDQAGRVLETKDALGTVTRYTYDLANRVLTRTQDPGDTGLKIQTSYTYDAKGQVIWTKDANNTWTRTQYNLNGRVEYTVVDPSSLGPSGGTTGLAIRTEYTYDAQGQTLTVIQGAGKPEALKTKYEYDALGRRKREVVDPDAGRLALATGYTYNKNDQLVARTDAKGQVTRYVYDAENRLAYTVDATGAVTYNQYDKAGRLTRTTAYATKTTAAASITELKVADIGVPASGADQSTSYVYDKDGRRTFGIDALGYITQYEYDKAGNVVQQTRYNNLPSTNAQESADGAFLSLSAPVPSVNNDKDQVTRTVYDKANRALWRIDALNGVTGYAYDKAGHVTRVTKYATTLITVESNRQALATGEEAIKGSGLLAGDWVVKADTTKDQTTRYVYDAAGRQTKEIVDPTPTGGDGQLHLGLETTTFYNSLGQVTRRMDAAGNSTRYVYDKAGRQTHVSDASGSIAKTEYDALGHVTKTSHHGDAFQASSAMRLGYVDSTHNAVSRAIGTFAAGDIVKVTVLVKANPNTLAGFYLGHGPNTGTDTVYKEVWGNRDSADGWQEVTIELPALSTSRTLYFYFYVDNGATAANTASAAHSVLIDQLTVYRNGVASISDGFDTSIDPVYTLSGAVSREDFIDYSSASDASIRLLASNANRDAVTRFEYDTAGRVVAEIRADGLPEQSETRYKLDEIGQRTQVIDPRGIAAATKNTDTAIDDRALALGRKRENCLLIPVKDSADYNAILAYFTTARVFDGNGRITDTTDPRGGITTTTYDVFGNAIELIDPNDKVGIFFFDKLNRQTFMVNPNGFATETEYDAFGGVSKITRYFNTVNGQLSSSARPQMLDAEPATAPSGAYLVRTSVVQADFGLSYGGDAVTNIQHDKLGRQTTIANAGSYQETLAYDALGNKKSVANKVGGLTTLKYDRRGLLIEEILPQKVDAIDESGRAVFNGAGDRVQYEVRTTYRYDAMGNRIEMIEAAGLAEQRVTHYAYDSMGRMTAKEGQDMQAYTVERGAYTSKPLETRKYDSRGNVIEVGTADGARTLTWWDALDRKIAELQATGKDEDGNVIGTLITYDYNTGGDLVRQRTWGQSIPLPQDAKGAVPIASATDVRSIQYVYNANHLVIETRIKSVFAGEVAASGNFSADLQDLVSTKEYDRNGNVTIETDPRGNKTYHYYDNAGNLLATVDADRYLILWIREAGGNEFIEFKGSERIPDDYDLSAASDVSKLAFLASGELDRATYYYRDKLGRVIFQTTFYGYFDPIAKTLVQRTSDTFAYQYNGLDLVTAKVASSGEGTLWGYDAAGREISKSSNSFLDFEGNNVTPTTNTEYNGLGMVQRVVQRGKDNAVETDDRITLYKYGANGYLASMTDAAGGITKYEHDLAGRTTRSAVGRHDATDTFDLTQKKGKLYLERINQEAGASLGVTYQTAETNVVLGIGTTLSVDIELGKDDRDRSFTVGLQSSPTGASYHVAKFVGNQISASYSSQVSGQTIAAAKTVANNKIYTVTLLVEKNGAGQFTSTLRVYEKGSDPASGYVDTKILGTSAWNAPQFAARNYGVIQNGALDATDAVDNLILSDAQGNRVEKDFSKHQDYIITPPSGYTLTNMRVFGADGASGRGVIDVEESKFDALGRQTSQHTFSSVDGEYANPLERGNGALVVANPTGSTDWSSVNSAEAVTWGNGTAFKAEITPRQSASGQIIMGILTDKTEDLKPYPADIKRHYAQITQGTRISAGNAGGVSTQNTSLPLTADVTYIVEIQVEWSASANAWYSRLYVYQKGSARSGLISEVKFTAPWKQVLVNIASNGGARRWAFIDNVELHGADGKTIKEDFDYRGEAFTTLVPDSGVLLSVQDSSGASDATNSTTTETRYNAYGEVIAKGSNGGWQEWSQYDNAGRLVRSSGTDGVPRIYVLDAGGNVTLTLAPPADGETSAEIAALFKSSAPLTSGDIKTLLNGGAKVVVSTYSNRNQLTNTFEASSAKLLTSIDAPNATVGSIQPEEVKVYLPSSTVAISKSVTVKYSYDSDIYSNWTGGGSGNDRTIQSIHDVFKLELSKPPGAGQKYRAVLEVDNGHYPTRGNSKGYVNGTTRQIEDFTLTADGLHVAKTIDFPRYATAGYRNDYGWPTGATFRIKIYLVSDEVGNPLGELVSTVGGSLPGLELPPIVRYVYKGSTVGRWGNQVPVYAFERQTNVNISAAGELETANPRNMTFSTFPTGASKAVLVYRMTDQGDAAWRTASVNVVNGKAVFGEDLLRAMGTTLVGTAEKPMAFSLYTMDAQGRLMSVQAGEVTVSRDASAANYYYSSVTKSPTVIEDRTGQVFATSAGVNFVAASQTDLTKQPVLANSAVVFFRKVGEQNWGSSTVVSPTTLGGSAMPGWFQFNPPSPFVDGQKYEYIIELRKGANGTGDTIDTLNGYLTAKAGTVSGGAYQVYLATEPLKYDRRASLVRFHNVPAATASVTLQYKLTKRVWTDTTGAPLPAGRLVVEREGSIALQPNAAGEYIWDAAIVGLDPEVQYTLEYTFTAKDVSNQVLGTVTSRDPVRTGTSKPQFSATIYSPSAASSQYFRITSAKVQLTHSTEIAQQVCKVVLYYRKAGTNDAYTAIEKSFTPGADGRVTDVQFDLSTLLTPGANYTDFDIYYQYKNGLNQVILGYTVDYKEDYGAPTQYTPLLVRVLPPEDASGNATDAGTAIWGFVTSPGTSRREQGYNAFGEVMYELTAEAHQRIRAKQIELGRTLETSELLGYASWYRYDGGGRLVYKQDPVTNATMEDGAVLRGAAYMQYSYDELGRLKGERDVLGHVTGYVMAATGDATRLVATEYRTDNTGLYEAVKYGYDVFGELRRKTLKNGDLDAVTDYKYDAMGRLVRVDLPKGADNKRATHLYTYDSKGNRITHRTSPDAGLNDATGLFDSGEIVEYTSYDAQGRVRKTISGEKLVTKTDYRVTRMGYTSRVYTDASQLTMLDWLDYAGRTVRHVDMGSRIFNYSYNLSGNLLQQYQTDKNDVVTSGGQNITYTYWADGTLRQINDHTLNAISEFKYDKDGNRTFESYTVDGTLYQSATAKYDELGRIISVTDPRYYTVEYEYDVLGNRRRVHSTKYGIPAEMDEYREVDYWYAYDAQNRMVVSMGVLDGGRAASYTAVNRIKQGTSGSGVALGYDKASNRTSALYAGQTQAEIYTYTADGYLTKVTKNGAQISKRTNDLLGRVTGYEQNNDDGLVTETHTYDKDNRALYTKITNSKADSDVIETWNSYKVANVGDARTETGKVTSLLQYSTTVSTPPASGSKPTITHIRYDYEWWDSAQQLRIKTGSTNVSFQASWGKWATGVSQFFYNANGHVKQVIDSQDGTTTNARTINFVSNASGLILARRETGEHSVLPFQNYFYIDNRRIVEWSNAPITGSVTYSDALISPASDQANPRDRYRNLGPIRSNVDQNYRPINADYPGFTPGGYTVRSGDNLRTIARAVWGDETLWYLIADANGLADFDDARVGQTLVIPNKVTNLHNNSQTIRVYNAGEVMGDVSPTTPNAPVPPPPKEGGCGALAMVLIIVVAVIATIATAGAAAMGLAALTGSTAITGGVMAAGMSALAGGIAVGTATMSLGIAVTAAAIGGAVGSIAGQLTGMATGVMDKFQWSQVGISALTSAAGSFVGGSIAGPAKGASIYTQAAYAAGKAAVGNIAGQQLARVAGLQRGKFSWTAVASSAVGAAASFGVQEAIGSYQWGNTWGERLLDGATGQTAQAAIQGDLMGTFVRGMSSGVAAGWGASLAAHRKTDWVSAAVSSFGSALGDAVVGSIVQAEREKQQRDQMYGLASGDGKGGLKLGRSSGGNGLQMTGSAAATFSSDVDSGIAAGARQLAEQEEIDRQKWANWDRASTQVFAQEDLQADAEHRASVRQQHANADAVRREMAQQAAASRRAPSEDSYYALRMSGGPRGGAGRGYEYDFAPTIKNMVRDGYMPETDLAGRVTDKRFLPEPGLESVHPEEMLLPFGKAFKAIGGVAKAVYGEVRGLWAAEQSMLQSSRTGLSTGVAHFDGLFAESAQATKMVSALERRGVTVVDDVSRLDAGASAQVFRENGKLTLVYDSQSTSFIDMLHEARHVAQVQRVEAAGVLGNKDIFGSARLLGAAERGAYEYELRLGASKQATFSADYTKYVQRQLERYYPSSYSSKFNASPSMRSIFNAMEPGLTP